MRSGQTRRSIVRSDTRSCAKELVGKLSAFPRLPKCSTEVDYVQCERECPRLEFPRLLIHAICSAERMPERTRRTTGDRADTRADFTHDWLDKLAVCLVRLDPINLSISQYPNPSIQCSKRQVQHCRLSFGQGEPCACLANGLLNARIPLASGTERGQRGDDVAARRQGQR
jgi:hypothetical protein